MRPKATKRRWAVTKSQESVKKRAKYTLYQNVGMPRRITLRMNYVDEVLFNTAISDTVTQVYRGNSIHDPDFTGIGHQPLGHDEWATLYNRYRVISSKITIHWMNVATPAQEQTYVCVPMNGSGTPLFGDACETVGSKLGAITEGKGTMTMVNECSSLAIKGDRRLVNDKDLEALFGANPNTQWFWVVQAKSPGTTAVDSRALIKIEYLVELFDRKSLVQS